jgi:YVTN family beta-propeller protein
MSKKYLRLTGGIAVLLLATGAFLFYSFTGATNIGDKVYVAAEDAGRIDVISTKSRSVKAKIDLSQKQGDKTYMYMAHNVQVAPDGKSVWVTANAMSDEHTSFRTKVQNILSPTAYADNGHEESTANDQLIVIDPFTDKITKRIDIGSNLHLAHVVLTPDSKYAVAVAQEKGEIYKVDANNYQIVSTIPTRQNAEPHGLRMTSDGRNVYIAMMGDKSIGQLNLETASLTYIPLSGKPVQTGVSADGKYALATVFDTRSVAVYNIPQKQLNYIDLPKEAKGPLQLYPTPDAKYAFVADQGNYFGQPDGDKVYKVDLQQLKVVETIKVGTAPHGVVVSPDGKTVYVTNLVSNDVSIVDTATNKEVGRVSTGAKPNGISYWVKK